VLQCATTVIGTVDLHALRSQSIQNVPLQYVSGIGASRQRATFGDLFKAALLSSTVYSTVLPMYVCKNHQADHAGTDRFDCRCCYSCVGIVPFDQWTELGTIAALAAAIAVFFANLVCYANQSVPTNQPTNLSVNLSVSLSTANDRHLMD
jgi:hypothetical protein